MLQAGPIACMNRADWLIYELLHSSLVPLGAPFPYEREVPLWSTGSAAKDCNIESTARESATIEIDIERRISVCRCLVKKCSAVAAKGSCLHFQPH